MTLPVLSVDPAKLSEGGSALVSAAGAIPGPLAPISIDGSDPLSTAIGAGAQAVEAPMADLPAIKQSATSTANNIITAANYYAQTDENLSRRLDRHQFDGSPGSEGSAGSAGSACSAGGASAPAAAIAGGGMPSSPVSSAPAGGKNPVQQFGQLPMQMAQQAGQMPQQLGGMMGSGPQGLQSAVQQVSQMAGQFGKQDKGLGDSCDRDNGFGDQSHDRGPTSDAASGPDGGERAPVVPSTRSEAAGEFASGEPEPADVAAPE
jgi:hypothetical protein